MAFAYIKFIHDPNHPDAGLPGEGGVPGHDLPEIPNTPISGRPPRIWPPVFPPRPTDPSWGVGGGGLPPLLPILIGPGLPLPPVDGGTPPPTDPPPGTIWPPLPPGSPVTGKVALLVWVEGVGCRYVVVEIPPPDATTKPLPPNLGKPTPPGEAPATPPTGEPTEQAVLGAAMDTTGDVVATQQPTTTAEVGSVMKLGTDYMTVTDASDRSKLKVTRGSFGSTIEAHPAGVTFPIWGTPAQPK